MRTGFWLFSVLVLAAVGCKDSGAPVVIDPIAVDYCAVCSEFDRCEGTVQFALDQVCSDEMGAWYTCATNNGCDFEACDTEWLAREACIDAMIPDGGT